MKIYILGTRGIPNNYGGFEQFAEYLGKSLAEKGEEVWVYNSHNHPYKEKIWKGVNIIHCYDPEYKIGTIGQFIYDLNCIWHLRKQKPDIVLQLGYTSSSIWGWLLPTSSIVITNMDGLEWKRTKYSFLIRNFLKFAEYLGVKFSDFLISDSIGIQQYLKKKYSAKSTYIPYGANIFKKENELTLTKYNLIKGEYDMLIARMEPENSIETILDGVVKANTQRKFVVIGNISNSFGKYLKEKFNSFSNIIFLGSIYNINDLNNLRFYSNIYFHGHTVGGTNPSLLEAMSSYSFICAHDNIFNRTILGLDAIYFNNELEVAKILKTAISEEQRNNIIKKNIDKITNLYSWDNITNQYYNMFIDLLKSK